MSGNRQRLRPWLIAKINSGDIKGLYWLNDAKTIFRIPWKHGGKQDWSPEHSEVFKEWARHTGKFREGLDAPEWAKWKTRLRCAFNKAPDIMEIKEQSEPDAANPFKVYMFKDLDKLSKKAVAVAPKKPVARPTVPVSTQPQLPVYVDEAQVSKSGDLPSDLVGIPSLELVRGAPGDLSVNMMSTESISMSSFGEVKIEDDAMDTNEPVAIDPSPFPTNEATGAPLLPPSSTPSTHPSSSPLLGATPASALPSPYSPASSDSTFDLPSPAASDVSGTSTVYQYQPQSSSPLQGDLPGMLPYAATPVEEVGYDGQESIELTGNLTELKTYQELPSHVNIVPGTVSILVGEEECTLQAVFTEELDLPLQLQGHEMNVRVQYLTHVVLEEFIDKKPGCRLYYGSESDIRSVYNDELARKILGPDEASPLHLPPCLGILQGKQMEYAQMLLENITRGIFIECVDGDIYATRFCKCIIYYCNEDQQEGIKLLRHQRTKIFDFTNMFLPKYQSYIQDMRGAAPSAEVCLSFGQQSYYVNLSESTLISAYILSLKAYNMLDTVGQGSRTTTLDIEDMQISEADEIDHQLDDFRLAVNM